MGNDRGNLSKKIHFFLNDFNKITSQINIEKLRNKSIFITGASGLIGKYLTWYLIHINEAYNLGLNIYLSYRDWNKENKRTDLLDERYIKYIKFDGIEFNDFNLLPKKIDFLINLASNSSPDLYITDLDNTVKTNINSIYQIIDLALKKNAEKVFFASTVEIYNPFILRDNSQNRESYETDLDLNDIKLKRFSYSMSKFLSELIIANKNTQDSIVIPNTKFYVGRLDRIYGPTVKSTDKKLTTQIIQSIINNTPLELLSLGTAKVSYTYVGDSISAILHMITNNVNPGAYNITSGNCIMNVSDLLEKLKLSRGLNYIHSNSKLNYYSSYLNQTMSLDKLKSTGWRPLFDFDDSFVKTLEFIKKYRKEDFLV